MFPVEACHQRYKGSTADHYAHLVNRAGGAVHRRAVAIPTGCSAGGRGAARRSRQHVLAAGAAATAGGVGTAHGYPRVLRRDSRRVLTPRGWAADTASG